MIIEWPEFRKMALKLIDGGYIPIFGEMNEQLEEVVIECIFVSKNTGKKSMTLLINSTGGWNLTYAAIKAAMIESGLEFNGLVMGRAFSNAFNLLQQCDTRSAVEDASLMFHWGNSRLGNQELAALIAGETWPVEHALAIELMTAEQVSRRTGLSVEKLKEFALYERSFTAQQAFEMKFLDQVIRNLPKKVQQMLEDGKKDRKSKR
ncbi:ATP-dependent Clp protease proteolytic subunit [Candidatus Woesebacteria bacterium]|nr:ATP-dependent Clp protease proteolytic subunit [Candidatus Woesebacteria bacterium]QQG47949.1 MAG: ATP-dependent Clp protease proteolytic subunit [Candidatus Woesebacteria bacterium]